MIPFHFEFIKKRGQIKNRFPNFFLNKSEPLAIIIINNMPTFFSIVLD